MSAAPVALAASLIPLAPFTITLPLDHDSLRHWMAMNDVQLHVAVDHTTFSATVSWKQDSRQHSLTRTNASADVAIGRALAVAVERVAKGTP